MANFQEYVDKDLIPNNPGVIKGLEEGKYSLEDVQSKYATFKASRDAEEKAPFGSPAKTAQNILDKAVDDDEIPMHPEVVQGIKDGKYTFDQVKSAYNVWKQKQVGIVTANEKAELNKPEDIYATAIDSVTNPKPSVTRPFYKAPGELTGNVVENFSKIVQNDYAKGSYIAKEYAEGLTFDIYDNPEEAPDTISYIMGGAAKLVGYGISGVLGGGLISKVPVVGEALGAISGAAKTATGATKHALQVASIAAEGGAMGFGAGVAKGIVEGERTEDILAEGALTAAEFAVGGALLYPVGVAAGKGLEKYGRIKFGKRAEALTGKVEELVQKDPQYYIEKLKTMDQEDEGVQQALRYANAALKIKATQPMSGPFPMSDKLNNPKAIEAIYKGREDDLANIVKGAYIGDDAPLSALYDSEPTIKSLVDTGKYAEAMMVGQTFFREQLKKNKNVQEMINSSFVQDSKYVYDVLADRVLGKLDKTVYPTTSRNLITNYLSDLERGAATKKDLKTLRDVVAGQDKQARKAFGSTFTGKEKLLDTRLTADEADSLVGKILDDHLKVLSGNKENILFGKPIEDFGYHAGDLGKAKDTQISRMSGRTTGHFGTGTYFVGNENYFKTIGGDYKNRPLNKINFNKYNLFRPINEAHGRELNNVLKEINSLMGDDITIESASDIVSKLKDISNKISISPERVQTIMKNISSEIKKSGGIYMTKGETASTRIMKAAGFEGIDVRGISGLDNTTFGSVIYDLHPTIIVPTKAPFGSVAKIAEASDEQGMLKAALWANKQLHSDMASAYARGVNSVNDALVVSNPKAQAGLRDEVRIRTTSIQVSNDVNRIRELKMQLKEKNLIEMSRKDVAAALKEGQPLDEAMAISQEINALKGSLSDKYKVINKAKSNIDSLDQPVRDEITKIAENIYIPGKKDLGLNRNQTTELLTRFGWKDSPVYLKASDELVDMISAMNHTGIDMTDAFTRKFNLPFISNVENYRRIAQREFGYNNPIDTYLRGIRDADMKANDYKAAIMNQLRPLGIKKGTKESALLFDMVEGNLQQGSEAFNKLTPDIQKKLLEGKEVVKGIYEKSLNDINEVMRVYNLPEIAKRDNYITHYVEAMELYPTLVRQLENAKDPEALKSLNIFFSNRKGDPSKTFMSWELPRSGAEHTKDAIGAIEKYIKPAAERIYYTPLVRGLDTAKSFATGENAIKFLQHIKDNVLLKRPNEWTEAASPGINTMLGAFQKRLAKGALFGNINTVIQQVASTPLSLLVGGKEALIATVNRFSKDSAELMAMSQNLHLRSPTEWVDMDARLFKGIMEWANKIPGSQTARAGYNYWQKFTEWGLKTFDKEAASHAFITGIAKGRSMGITDKKQLAALGDAYADMLQGSFAKVDRPMVMDTPIARAFFQFQSFAMNLGATIMTDLPVLAKQEGVGRTIKSLLRTAAGASVVNAIAEENGMPPPFSLSTFLPGASTFRFGAPGAFAAIGSTVKFATGAADAKQFGKDVKKLAVTMAVPAGGQIYKTAEALTSRDVRKKDRLKAAIFGKSTQKFQREAKRSERKSFGYKAKKQIKKAFGL